MGKIDFDLVLDVSEAVVFDDGYNKKKNRKRKKKSKDVKREPRVKKQKKKKDEEEKPEVKIEIKTEVKSETETEEERQKVLANIVECSVPVPPLNLESKDYVQQIIAGTKTDSANEVRKSRLSKLYKKICCPFCKWQIFLSNFVVRGKLYIWDFNDQLTRVFCNFNFIVLTSKQQFLITLKIASLNFEIQNYF